MPKGNRAGVGQGLPKSTKKGAAPRTSPVKKAAVAAGYGAGDSIREIARDTQLARETVRKIVDDIKPEHEELARQAKEITKQFYKDALQSYRYALREELDGRLAAEFLKAKGVIEDPRVRVQLSKAVEEDKRTPEQRAIDAKKRAMEALVSIAVDRSEAYGCPIDTSSEKSVREHVIELHPVGEGKER
jgi:transposase